MRYTIALYTILNLYLVIHQSKKQKSIFPVSVFRFLHFEKDMTPKSNNGQKNVNSNKNEESAHFENVCP